MPTYSGKTGERHVFTLPSAIERVGWSRRQGAPGGVAGLEIQTVWCGNGSSLEVELVDANGTTHATLSGALYNNHLAVDLRIPEAAEGAVMAKVQMPNHGLSGESEALRLTEPVRVTGPRWSQETVRRGDVVTLTAEARGAPNGRKALVRLFEYDEGEGAHDPVTRMYPRVEGGAVEVAYQFQYPGDTAGIVPEWEAPDGYRQPQYFYRVDVSGITADSKDAKSKGLMTFVDDLALQVVDARSGAPYPEQDVELTLADGRTETVRADGEGRVELEEMPPGPVKVRLPELGSPDEEAGERPEDARTVVATETPDGTPVARVTTGTTWQVAAGFAGGSHGH